MRYFRHALYAPASALLMALALATITSRPLRAQDGVAVGDRAPAAMLETLDGKPADLGRYLGKTPVVIEFWATWCPLCKELEPKLQAAATKYGARVKFVGVAVSVNQTPERVKLYAEKHKLPLEVLFDRKGAATDAYGVFATSTVVVIDRGGTIVYIGQGGAQNIEAAIKRAL